MRYSMLVPVPWLTDFGILRDVAQAADEGGLDALVVGGHVLTAAPNRYPDRPEETYSLPYRDPFVLFTHLAGVTNALTFRTGILTLPLHSTALVAKQAADVSLMSGGRFELGVGIGWQDVEYVALGHEPKSQGARLEEQITVLRKLWTSPRITFSGRWHEIDDLGLGQLPSHPIEIWIGCGEREAPLRRVARMADGWFAHGAVDLSEAVPRLHGYLREAGRPVDAVSISAPIMDLRSASLLSQVRRLTDLGVDELSLWPREDIPPLESIADLLASRDAIAAEVGTPTL